MKLYWGDLHNHCDISYGYGSLENALQRAREHLDFCAVTGHAMWPDMPAPRPELEYLISYHLRGFAKLAAHWDEVRTTIERANKPGQFVTLQSYEIHSGAFGDHHILSPDGELPLLEAESPHALVQALAPRPVIAVPHHIAYVPGYRGINWATFDPAISPVIEVYSKHGCSMSDTADYPFLHTMGPRDGRNTVRAGLSAGHQFGFVASTDHHAGYPGSYGDGRVGIWAEALTREAIWDALLKRRTIAVTGDKIHCRFEINGMPLGSSMKASTRDVYLEVEGGDVLDRVTVFKNGRPWKIVEPICELPAKAAGRFKLRVEMGWGSAHEPFLWQGELVVQDGVLCGVEPCFVGASVLAPSRSRKENPDINALRNRILSIGEQHVAWECTSWRNPTMLHPATAALILELEGDAHTRLMISLNGRREAHTLGELIQASRGYHLQPYASEAFLLHQAIPQSRYQLCRTWRDESPEQECDVYDVEVRQVNRQYAWVSPIFVYA